MKAAVIVGSMFLVTVFLLAGCGMSISPDAQAQSDYHYKLARNYYNDHNIAMTQKELHESLALDPSNAEARHLKGFMLMGLRDFEGAAHEFKLALQFNPDLREARNNLGVVLIEQGNYEEAIEVIEPLTMDPLYPTPYFARGNLGLAYMNLGDLENARKHLEMAVFLSPSFCLGYNNLGLVFLKMQKIRDAQDNFAKAVKFCPDNYGEPWYHLGVLHQKAGRHDEALAAFQKCSEILGESPLGKRCSVRAAGDQAE